MFATDQVILILCYTINHEICSPIDEITGRRGGIIDKVPPSKNILNLYKLENN